MVFACLLRLMILAGIFKFATTTKKTSGSYILLIQFPVWSSKIGKCLFISSEFFIVDLSPARRDGFFCQSLDANNLPCAICLSPVQTQAPSNDGYLMSVRFGVRQAQLLALLAQNASEAKCNAARDVVHKTRNPLFLLVDIWYTTSLTKEH